MSNYASVRVWSQAQASVLLAEYGKATGRIAMSMEEAEWWFIGLPLAERDRVGRKLRDPDIIGWYLETPKIDDLPVIGRVSTGGAAKRA
jgi:hypothetical protein